MDSEWFHGTDDRGSSQAPSVLVLRWRGQNLSRLREGVRPTTQRPAVEKETLLQGSDRIQPTGFATVAWREGS